MFNKKKNNTIFEIYEAVLDFCESKNLLRAVKESLLVPEAERFTNRDIESDGLDLLDAVHCVMDKNRCVAFLEEIFQSVESSDVVVEAGIGTGLLSFAASVNAKKVYGLEINKETLELAIEIKNYLIGKEFIKGDNLELIAADATRYIPKEKIDVLISENLYTGMFAEQQVQIMSNLLNFTDPNAKIIPNKIESFISVNQTDLSKTEGKIFIPAEIGSKIKSIALSEPVLYDRINFGKITNKAVNKNIQLKIDRPGVVNSILIFSEVSMPSGKRIKRHDANFFNDDVIFSIPNILVRGGDVLSVHLNYKYGSKLKDLNLEIKNLS